MFRRKQSGILFLLSRKGVNRFASATLSLPSGKVSTLNLSVLFYFSLGTVEAVTALLQDGIGPLPETNPWPLRELFAQTAE